MGNNAAHNDRNITAGQAAFALENLFYFMDFVAFCYGENYQKHIFNKQLLEQQPHLTMPVAEVKNIPLAELQQENKTVAPRLTAQREEKRPLMCPFP